MFQRSGSDSKHLPWKPRHMPQAPYNHRTNEISENLKAFRKKATFSHCLELSALVNKKMKCILFYTA